MREEEGAAIRYFVPKQERMRKDGSNNEPVLIEEDQQSESPVRTR